VSNRSPSFEAFYNEHYDAVRRGLCAAFRDASLAEDAAQESFIRAYMQWRRVSQMDRPDGWVYVVAVRVAMRRRPPAAIAETPSISRDIADTVVTHETLRAAIELLPDRQRLAIVLRYLADLSVADVAAAMGCAPGTVKSTLHAALTRLQVELDELDEIEEVDLDAP
jgi:RNA polymerase sigma factor (sigma-70 family)